MATASTSSTFRNLEEKTNGFKLMRLIIDLGTEALRNEFKKIHPGNLLTVLSSHQRKLNHLKARNIITEPQWDKLYPSAPMIPNIKEFDITLLVILLRNVCGVPAPVTTGWNKIPVNSDTSLGANIVRVKFFRNAFFGHIPETRVSTTEFEARWKEVSTTLVNLGISKTDIDRLKDEECGEEEVDRIRKEWSEKDTKIALQFLGLNKMCTENRKVLQDIQSKLEVKTENAPSNDFNLNKYLDSCNFDTDIELISQKLCKGTREWVFDEVSTWFNDSASDSRAFIITGQAGMGKSVIAAVICKRFAAQLGAFHFCQYNNDRYKNPKILLQSLATQLSNVIPEYRQALTEKLSGKEGQTLDGLNIQGLFALLFKEPFTGIKLAERHLIVIDAVDESQQEGTKKVFDVIADSFDQLPRCIRFLITSRPENNIAKNFEKVKSMFLSPSDEQNIKDIQRFFENNLSCPLEKLRTFVEKSEGLMLNANYLLENSSFKLDNDDLPSGIGKIYQSYFQRWENEFQNVDVGDNDFFTFLSVMVVAKQPLPEALVERVFEKSSSPTAKRKMNKIKNCLSSLIVMKQGHVKFFPKLVKDWLVKSGHDFTVDERFGHEILAKTCAKEMDEMKKNVIKPPFLPAAEYALLYGIQHKLEGTQEAPLKTFIDRYVTDLEIVYACFIVDGYALLNNIISLKKNIIYSSLPEVTHKTVEALILLIRKYIYTFKDFPQSFFQCVLNRGGDELSSKAASLLESRYKEQVYFELTEKDVLEDSLVECIYLSDGIIGFDVSPSEDYLICGYRGGILELFSLEDFKPLWMIQDLYLLELPTLGLFLTGYRRLTCHPIVFHPRKNVILPGRLDCVVNLHGKREPGLFLCEDIDPRFYSCCFSNDQSKMATTYANVLTVWSLVNNEKLRSFSTVELLESVMFSGNGRFLATLDKSGLFVVYDLENNFISASETFEPGAVCHSTFKEDSWIVAQQRDIVTVKFHLSRLTFTGSYERLKHLTESFPSNIKAVADFEAAFENQTESWLSKFGDNVFFCLRNGTALVWETRLKVLQFFRISKLKEAASIAEEHKASRASIFFSADGKFIYETGAFFENMLIHEVACNLHGRRAPLQRILPLRPCAPVANGVFFCGKLDDSSFWLKAVDYTNTYLGDMPELWNSDLTERLDSFPQLSGTKDCRPVSKEIVACIMDGKVCFFDVKRKVISEISVPRNQKVIACGSMNHVLTNPSYSSFPPLCLWRNGEVVRLNDVPHKKVDENSGFSPSGKTLALRFFSEKNLNIFNVSPFKPRPKVRLKPFVRTLLGFLDEDHLICLAYESSMCIINITSGDALACIDCAARPWCMCVSRTPDNCSVLLGVNTSEKLKLIKVWLPRQT